MREREGTKGKKQEQKIEQSLYLDARKDLLKEFQKAKVPFL